MITVDLTIYRAGSGSGSGGALIPSSSSVANFAALPPAAAHNGEVYWVRSATGVWPVNRRNSGAYQSDGVNWIKANNAEYYMTDETHIIIDDVDPTIRTKFDISANTPGQTRVHTLQDKNGVLAHLSDIPSAIKGHRHIYFPINNAVVTVIPAANIPVKISGVTTFGFGTAGWDMPVSNRITNNTGSTKRVRVLGRVSLDKIGAGGDENFTVYIAQTGAVLLGSAQKTRNDNADNHHCTVEWVGDVANGQYFELYMANDADGDDAIAVRLSLSLQEI